MCQSACPPKTVKHAFISDLVRELENDATHTQREAAEAKATLILNFGPDGRTQPGLVRGVNQSLTAMICNVFDYYHEALKAANLSRNGLIETQPFE